jgi:hypothetical protein
MHNRLVLLLAAVLLSRCNCDNPGTDATGEELPSELARGEAVEVQVDCGGGLMKEVLELLDGLPGTPVESGFACYESTRELFAGTTLGGPVGDQPNWDEFGGRGRAASDAAICMLRDLANRPLTVSAPADALIGEVSVEQEVGYLDFNPEAKRLRGYQKVRVCAPLVGCLDALLNGFEAYVTQTSPSVPEGLTAGDYRIDASYGLVLVAEESEQSINLHLPAIPVATPVGTINIEPEMYYGANHFAIHSPYAYADVPYVRMMDKYVQLWDVYGRNEGTVTTAWLEQLGTGWGSQVGWGARGANADTALWVGTPDQVGRIARPDVADGDMATPRHATEQLPTVAFGASLRATYDPLSLFPEQLLALINSSYVSIPQHQIFIEPKFDGRFTTQLDLVFREGAFQALDIGAGGNPAREEFILRAAAESYAGYSILSGLDLKIEARIPALVGHITITLVDTHPRVEAVLADDSAYRETVASRAAVLYDAVTGEVGYEHMNPPSAPDSQIDAASFVETCLTTPPPATETAPEPEHDPGNVEDLTAGLLTPCNVCVAWPSYNISSDNGADHFETEGGAVMLLPPTNAWNTSGFGDWSCYVQRSGCFDLCEPGADGYPSYVVESALALNPTCNSVR